MKRKISAVLWPLLALAFMLSPVVVTPMLVSAHPHEDEEDEEERSKRLEQVFGREMAKMIGEQAKSHCLYLTELIVTYPRQMKVRINLDTELIQRCQTLAELDAEVEAGY